MMRQLLIVLSLALSLACSRKEETTFVILHTTDLHGVLGSEMSALAGYIHQQREAYGGSLILLDGGDNFQGTPQVFFANFIDTTYEHIYTRLFNWLSYNVITPGNHDIEAGRKVFDRVYAASRADVVCANAIVTGTGEPYFKPYTVIRRKGWKIAVMGLLTPFATEWIPDHLRGGIHIDNPEKAAIYWTDRIYRDENPDLLIGLFHTGWGDAFLRDTSESAASIGAWIARNVPGFQLICCGHVHHSGTDHLVNVKGDTVYMIEAGSRASHIARAEIQLVPAANGKPRIKVSTAVISSRELTPYSPYDQMIKGFLLREEKYNAQEFCELLEPVYSREAMFGPSAWIDEIHRVQLSWANSGNASRTGAAISFVSPSARNLVLYAGPLRMKDFVRALPYENTLSVVSMTGQEVIRFLEYAYSLRLDDPTGPAYNFDSAAGIVYRVDRKKPAGSRVRIIHMADGSPFSSEEQYHVVMSTYRARGGGGHMTAGIGLTPDELLGRIVWVSERDIRTIFRDELIARTQIRPRPLNHWRYL